MGTCPSASFEVAIKHISFQLNQRVPQKYSEASIQQLETQIKYMDIKLGE